MKKFLAIILCLCIFVLPMKVVALDYPQALGTVATNEQTELTAESETLYPANSPEAQAIEKIHAHMRASGETVSIPRSQASGLIDGGIYNIKNYFSGKYLNVCYGTDANGTNVYQYTKDGSVEQKFKVVYDSSTDSYKLYAMCSSNGNNRVIDVKRGGAALASGQNVDIWTPVDHTAQRLEITYLTYNIYHISMKANTGLYLTTRDSSNGTKAGTSATSAGNVHINSFDVNLNQQWAFEYLGNATPEPEPATPTGSLDVVNANVISGWAWRSDLPNSPINVNIQVIGSNGITYLNTTVSANEYNSTIYNTGYGNGYHGFSYNIIWGNYPAGQYQIRAYAKDANGNNIEISNSPKYYVNTSVITNISITSNSSAVLTSTSEHIYSFTPTIISDNEKVYYYNIYTTGSADTYGRLYDSNSNLLISGDNGAGGYNFKMTYQLEAGVTYYIKVTGSAINGNGTYAICVENAFIDKLQQLHNLAKEYTANESTSVGLVMQFIRRGKYNGSYGDLDIWGLAAGDVDNEFVSYVLNNDYELYEHFTISDEYYWYRSNGDIIDIPHLAATYNVLHYNTVGNLGGIYLAENIIDNLGGWGGDLRSTIPFVLRDVNYSTDYNVVYNETMSHIGGDIDESYFSIADLLADIDAYNLYNNTDNSSLKNTFNNYYDSGIGTRYTDFTNEWSYDTIRNVVEVMLVDSAVQLANPIYKRNADGLPTSELLELTTSQTNAIADAFTDYLWERISAEI